MLFFTKCTERKIFSADGSSENFFLRIKITFFEKIPYIDTLFRLNTRLFTQILHTVYIVNLRENREKAVFSTFEFT